MKRFVFIWQHTDGYTYSCETITPFECDDLDGFILKSVQSVKDSDFGAEVLNQYIQKDDVENLFHSFYDLDKWFENNKIKLKDEYVVSEKEQALGKDKNVVVSVDDLRGRCDFCKHQKYIGIYGKPCVVPEPCLYETGKKNWEHNGKFPTLISPF
jgi:hypothetical protein